MRQVQSLRETLDEERMVVAELETRAKTKRRRLKTQILDLENEIYEGLHELQDAFETADKLRDEVSQLRSIETLNQAACQKIFNVISKLTKKVN